MDLTEEEVQKILRLVDELDYGEIHLEVGALRIDLVKTPPGEATRSTAPPAMSLRGTNAAATPAPSMQETRGDAAADAPVPEGAHVVVAPVAGTFYRAPAPGAAPFVEPGQRVGAGDPVGLLEVMKLFNSVPAGVAGRVVRVLAADATAVVEGQPLIAIAPEHAA